LALNDDARRVGEKVVAVGRQVALALVIRLGGHLEERLVELGLALP
jgi:hypothetical protein